MKRIFTITAITILSFMIELYAGAITSIRSNSEPKNLRIVFEGDNIKGFKTDKKNDLVTVTILDSELKAKLPTINNRFLQNFKVNQSGQTLKITFNLSEQFKVKTFKIDQPDRVVIDVSSSGYINPPSMGEDKSKAEPVTKKAKKENPEAKVAEKAKTKTKEKEEPPVAPKEVEKGTEITLLTVKEAWSRADLDAVISSSTTLLTTEPNQLEAYIFRAQAWQMKGEKENNKNSREKFLQNAINDYQKVTLDSTNFLEGHAKMAELYKLLGDNAKAEEHYSHFLGNFGEEEQKPSAKEIIPQDTTNQADSLSSKEVSYISHIVNHLFLYIGSLLVVLIIIILVWLRKKMNDRVYEEVDDLPTDEPAKDDIFEKLRPKTISAVNITRSKVEDNSAPPLDLQSSQMEMLKSKGSVAMGKTEEDVLSKVIDEASDEDMISISLDESLRDRIIELYDDGYTNKEIAEQLKISYDEVNFIIRSLGEADNESKNKKQDVLNSSSGGVTDSQNEETMMMQEIQDLHRQGVSVDELANYFKKDNDEIEFILSLATNQKKDEIKRVSAAFSSHSFEELDINPKEELGEKIRELAEKGLSRREIAQKLGVGLDEIDLTASVLKIEFAKSQSVESKNKEATKSHESVIDWTKGSTPEMDPVMNSTTKKEVVEPFAKEEVEELPEEEIDEAMLISKALADERKAALEEEMANQINEPIEEISEPIEEISEPIGKTNEPIGKTNEPIEETNEPIEETNEPIEETNEPMEETNEPIASPTKTKIEPIKTAPIEIGRKEDLGIDFDNFLTTRSIIQDYDVAESRIFNFKMEDFKDIFADLPRQELNDETDLSNIEDEMRDLTAKSSVKNAQKSEKEENFFVPDTALRKQLAAEMKLNRIIKHEEVEQKFKEIDGYIEQKLKNFEQNQGITTPVKKVAVEPISDIAEITTFKSEAKSLGQSFDDMLKDLDNGELYQEEDLMVEGDDDMLRMKEIYQLLDDGLSCAEIAEQLKINLDDVKIYKKIKDGAV